MLFPSEMNATEIIGGKRIVNPMLAVAICDARDIAARKEREVERAGLTMHEAIERALLVKPRRRRKRKA